MKEAREACLRSVYEEIVLSSGRSEPHSVMLWEKSKSTHVKSSEGIDVSKRAKVDNTSMTWDEVRWPGRTPADNSTRD